MLDSIVEQQSIVTKSTLTQPIFILGSPRSGTSILTSSLRLAAKIPGCHEGHFLPLFSYLIPEVDRYYQAKHNAVNEKYTLGCISADRVKIELLQSIRTITDSFFDAPTWVDKSPGHEMIETVPYLKEAWSNAKFVFAKRRGIECIISRLKKFPKVPFEKHCQMWVKCMESWVEVRDSVAHSSIEIDQREIALQPQGTAQKLGAFLALKPQKIKKIGEFFIEKRPEQTGSKETELALDLTETGWTSEEIKIFQKVCGKINREFGYSETSSYYL
jgi:hypothetical protein